MSAFHPFADREALFVALCEELVCRARAAITARGVALLGLSGGSTPLPLYRAFARADLDWSRVVFALVDERWVDVAGPGSNEAALREALAGALGAGATLVGMKNAAPTPAAGLAVCEGIYRALPLPFDLIVLGMGDDGHTASLFPHATGLDVALAPAAGQVCAAISIQPDPVAGAFTERMTLTLPAIRDARARLLLLCGESKRRVLELARAGTDIRAMPVRAVLATPAAPLDLWWAP